MVSHHPAKLSSHDKYNNIIIRDIKILVSHVILQDCATKGSSNSISRSLKYITILPSLVP